jgi:anti-sigma B factor antagonist
MSVEFVIEQRKVGDDTRIVSVEGEVDLFTAPEFRQRVFAPMARAVRRLIVDLSDTTFIDSAGLGVLIEAHRHLASRGGTMIVVCDHDAIVKTFRITGLDGVFTLASSVDDAVGDAVAARA